MILDAGFFNRSTLEVAQDLLGKVLVRKTETQELALSITEVEAYDGFEDKASHAHRGKTARNAVMFGNAGVWYIYLIYGMYWMLNIVTGPADYPAAVLIRGAGGIRGPGRLTKALGITQDQDGQAASTATGLWIEDRGIKPNAVDVIATPRIGVDYAGPIWAKKPYRFYTMNDECFHGRS